MGVFNFVKNAGAKLFGSKEKEAEATPEVRNTAIKRHIEKFNLRSENVKATLFDSAVTLEGTVDTLQEKNRIIMAVGNLHGIDKVEDKILVEEKVEVVVEPEKQFHTVVSGDTLSKIAKKAYGNANKYNAIFEANRPMLEHPDKIYPGQVLVIPQID
jgi:nucleoid-associated protein YgaU